jgi:toxin ParE1/3/4
MLLEAIAVPGDGPDLLGSSAREEILLGLRTLHIARKGRRGSHFIMHRAVADEVIQIFRILHDRVGLARHIPKPTT